jgi:mRNA-degrading endonuclease toxin of MazEF toxin-antitoxin module
MKVFLSYRRADTQPVALLVARFLARVPGLEAVFLDVEDIEVAENFQQKLLAELPKASHVIVLIGPQWRGPIGPSGTARIFETDDVVRQEVALALRGLSKVVPVLVDNAQMPKEAELPQELSRLSKINAFQLRTAHVDDDMYILVRRLTGTRARALAAPLTVAAIIKRALIGIAVGCLLVLGTALANSIWNSDPNCRDLACTVQKAFSLAKKEDAIGPMVILALSVIGLSALAPFIPRLLGRLRGA